MASKKSCAYMGEPFPDGSRVCIPNDHPRMCMQCSDGEWEDQTVSLAGSDVEWSVHPSSEAE